MKTTLILILLLAASRVLAQQPDTEPLACDCPDCREKAAAGPGFTLPGLEGLNEPEATDDHGLGEQHEHGEHDHAEKEEGCCPEDHGHADHGHVDAAEHAGHAHEHETQVEVSTGIAENAGIQACEAEGGIIAKTSVFPAEIKLNRDHAAAVSPRYASVVRQVFAEIGDEVKKGEVLASLENRETLAVYTVAAPLNGVVIAKDLALGETADADKVLYEVADLSSVWADISIFPQYQHLISKGMGVEFIAHDGHKAHGTVKYISPIVSHETRTFTARCILSDAGVDFTPGAFVRARITTETINVGVRVPRSAVQSVEGESVVFVPGKHGYEPVDVETGMADDHFIEIRQGLEPGDHYVASGAFTLKAELITSGMDPHAGHNH